MTPFEYLLVLVSILISLAIADIATSLHRLLRARHRIRWHWHSIVSALLVLLAILQFWWGFYRVGPIDVWSRYGTFLLLIAQLIVMFLLASAALPDEIPEQLDLEVYYDENRRYFWILFALLALIAACVNVIAGVDKLPLVTLVLPNAILFVLLLSLAFVRSRIYNSTMILLLLLAIAQGWFALKLGDSPFPPAP